MHRRLSPLAFLFLLIAPLQAYPRMHVVVHATKGTVTRPVELGAFLNGQRVDAGLSFDWDFGDGTGLITTGPVVFHQYVKPGAYQVTVIVTDTTHDDPAAATSEPIHAIVTER